MPDPDGEKGGAAGGCGGVLRLPGGRAGQCTFHPEVPAGLSGYAQVFGKYNTNPSDKLKLDLLYINQRSLLLDFKLMLYTVKILFIPESTEGVEETVIDE